MNKARLAKVEKVLSVVDDAPTAEDLGPMVVHMKELNRAYGIEESDAVILADLRAAYAKMGVGGAEVRAINLKVEAALTKIYGGNDAGGDAGDQID